METLKAGKSSTIAKVSMLMMVIVMVVAVMMVMGIRRTGNEGIRQGAGNIRGFINGKEFTESVVANN